MKTEIGWFWLLNRLTESVTNLVLSLCLCSALEFINTFIMFIISGERNLVHAASKAYTITLAPFHNMMVRGIFSVRTARVVTERKEGKANNTKDNNITHTLTFTIQLAVQAVPTWDSFSRALSLSSDSDSAMLEDAAHFSRAIADHTRVISAFYRKHSLQT